MNMNVSCPGCLGAKQVENLCPRAPNPNYLQWLTGSFTFLTIPSSLLFPSLLSNLTYNPPNVMCFLLPLHILSPLHLDFITLHPHLPWKFLISFKIQFRHHPVKSLEVSAPSSLLPCGPKQTSPLLSLWKVFITFPWSVSFSYWGQAFYLISLCNLHVCALYQIYCWCQSVPGQETETTPRILYKELLTSKWDRQIDR